jgi:hypothetical protein
MLFIVKPGGYFLSSTNCFVLKFFIIFSLFCTQLSNSFSQDNAIEIRGYIIDAITDAPLVNATIKIKNSELGAITNDLGEFFLVSTKIPVTLVFSFIGYESEEFTIEFEPLKPIVIQMNRKTSLLKGTVITAEKIDTVYRDRHYSVLDYALSKEGILLLVYRYTLNRSEILYHDYNCKKIASIPTLPGKPTRLFKDCLGNIHLFTRKRCFQINISKNHLKLYPAVSLESFMEVMQYCQLFHKNKLYYHEKGNFDLVNFYYSIDTLTKKRHHFHTVTDQDKLDFLKYNPENLSLVSRNFEPSMTDFLGFQSDGAVLDQIKNMDATLRFNKMAYFPSIYAPVFKRGDSIVIFNHPNSSIDIFDRNDSLQISIPISYHISGKQQDKQSATGASFNKIKWKKEVFIDPITNKAYTSFLKFNGTLIVKQIDLDCGKPVRSIAIPFPYVENINVRDGYMYYIYKGWDESQKKKLLRQRLE